MYPRTLFLINSFAVGGAERVFIDDIRTLQKAGWPVEVATLFAAGSLRTEVVVPEVRFSELAFRSCFDWVAHKRLVALIRDKNIECVVTTLNEANLVGRLTKRAYPHFRLITREANTAEAKGLVHKLADILLGTQSDQIAVVSRAVGESIKAYAPWLASRMQVFYNGYALQPLPHVVRNDGTTHLLSVGSLTPKKDHASALRALALLPDSYSLSIVGSGTLHSSLEALARELGVTERATFLGNIPFSEMAVVYASHDLFLLTSQYEGCPNVVSEAQAAGLPVVAFAIPGIQEFVPHDAGSIVGERTPGALADGVRSMKDHATRTKAAHQGREALVSTRTPEKHMHTLKALIHGESRSSSMRARAERYLANCTEYTAPSERARLIRDWEAKEEVAPKIVADFARRATNPRDKTILEVGFGNGVQLAAFAKAGAYTSGLEVNKELNDIAREYLTELGIAADLRLYEGFHFPFPDKSFDAAYSISVLEHVDDPRAVIQETARCLRPGGVFYVAFPNRWSPRETHTGMWFLGYVPRTVARAFLHRLGRTTIEDLNLHFLDYYTVKRAIRDTGLRIRMEQGRKGGLYGLIKHGLARVGVHYSALLPHVMLVLEKE